MPTNASSNYHIGYSSLSGDHPTFRYKSGDIWTTVEISDHKSDNYVQLEIDKNNVIHFLWLNTTYDKFCHTTIDGGSYGVINEYNATNDPGGNFYPATIDLTTGKPLFYYKKAYYSNRYLVVLDENNQSIEVEVTVPGLPMGRETLHANNGYFSLVTASHDDNKIYITTNGAAVSNPPVADFSADVTTIAEGGSVSFTDLSTNTPTEWSWDFGDDNSSSIENPSHTYNTAEIYTVSLTATNTIDSDTKTKTNYITVTESGSAPVADFSANITTTIEGGTVMFTDLSTNTPTEWSWDFGDGNTSTEQNPAHIFNTQGTYPITLTATNSYGSNTETKTNYINVTESGTFPVADFSANITTIIEGETVTFTDLSTNIPTGWSWNFGDGNSSSIQNPTHAYYTAGIYTVSLTATNIYGWYKETKTNYITVNIADYCDAGSDNSSYEYIGHVLIGSIDNSSDASSYSDYTALSTDVYAGNSQSFTITSESGYETDQVLIWVDWNYDGDFEDSEENVFISSEGEGPYSGTFDIPADVTSGLARVRIRLEDNDYNPVNSPCGNSGFGEVEDYTINVVGNDSYSVTFNVSDGTNNISGAIVTLTGYGSQTTNSDGKAIFSNVVLGTGITYTVAADSYISSNGTVNVVDSDINENVILNQEYYTITFVVNDGTNVISGANVTLTGYGSQTTNSDGNTVFTNVAPSTGIAYSVAADGYISSNGTVNVVDSDINENVILNQEYYTITFVVNDGTNVISAANVTIDEVIKTTDTSGETSFELDQGNYTYDITAVGYDNVSGDIDVVDTDVNEVVTLSINTGINDIDNELIEVYPNPTEGNINIQGRIIKYATISVIDISGKKIFTKKSDKNLISIDISEYVSGTYIIQITKDQSVYKRRIIKK